MDYLIKTYRPNSILDVGCGSGRLFDLYVDNHITDVIGIHISKTALAIAHRKFPEINTIQSRIEDLDFRPNRFDFVICNRILQHIPKYSIGKVISDLCKIGRYIYINELSDSDNIHENYYMVLHDYKSQFTMNRFELIKEGQIENQTYQFYGRD